MLGTAAVFEETRSVFFKAMLAGYLADKLGENVTKARNTTGTTTITFRAEDFEVIDRYSVISPTYSYGITTIFHKNDSVWQMTYGGHYPKEVIPFLKKVLTETYVANDFNGARGFGMYRDLEQGLWYRNVVNHNAFEKFAGREEIRKISTDELLGFHEYEGGLL